MRTRMNTFVGALLGSALLGACQDKPSQPTAPAAVAPAAVAPASADTATDTLNRVRAPRQPVPFVAPTKIGRILGDQSPSPPASRTR
jgi:uncharacterized lipoprotein YbaY